MTQLTTILSATQPFIRLVALVAGLLCAWGFATDLLPVLKQVWSPRVPVQTSAIVAAALALVGGAR